MIPEDESRPLPPDARLDATLRVVVGAVILIGGGFLLLEFVHWLANGGLRPFLIGAAFTAIFFFLLVLWSRLLSQGGRALQKRPSLYAVMGALTAAGILIQHFMAG
ncbi:hypothetical protein [Roseibacillus persicicus]|uniref:hypothetical protein n=1 Tax=Roseibacillus persicicus TaxID=454148 RepID=UPI00280DEEFE|nr:hypothetical protein [Roseibacillus persicicus]MDQ8189499.1 hypothetical protein [Roseibacillus persicicus]